MTDVFEITNKDLLGRTGKLYTPHGAVETPTVMPVINQRAEALRGADAHHELVHNI
jgi:tRNA-guanine family transglycosylase